MAAIRDLLPAPPTIPLSHQRSARTAETAEGAAKRRKITTHNTNHKSEAPNGRAPKKQKNTTHTPWRTFRHAITVTDYTVHVIRAAVPRTKGAWIAIADLSNVPITGLTRKILKAAR